VDLREFHGCKATDHTNGKTLSSPTAPFKPLAKAPLSSFQSASATFSASWTEQYDQAGLLLSFHPSTPSSSSSTAATTTPSSIPPRWIKTGLEYYLSRPNLSTVCCTTSADWSVAPVPSSSSQDVTIIARKEQDENGTSLWVYHRDSEGKEMPLREVCWVFENEGQGWDVEVSAFAARPEGGVGTGLEVAFREVVVKWE